MPSLSLTFLGTGTSQGVPLIGCDCEVCVSENQKDKRLRSSVLIQSNHTSIVIDTGPDFRQQMLREKVSRLDAVVFTHEHKDHIAGLDDIRAYNFLLKKKMPIYASERVFEALKREFHYIFFDDKYPGVPEIEPYLIDLNPFQISDIHITPITLLHYKLPVFGYVFNKKIAYITDANYISPEEMDKLKNIDVLVINALRKTPHISHFTLSQALQIISELNPKQAYLTHISHQLGLHNQVQQGLPSNVFVAFDGLKITV